LTHLIIATVTIGPGARYPAGIIGETASEVRIGSTTVLVADRKFQLGAYRSGG
jgi:hypothetical protein